MKLKNLFLAAMTLFAFSACTETPDAPYDFPGGNNGGGTTVEGTNLLSNSDFEAWEGGKPTDWGLTVTNGTYSQSSDANSGSNAVVLEGNSSSNKRLASKSYTLKPGTYTLAAYLKQSGDALGQFRLGYAKLTNGVVANTETDYIYLTSAAAVSSSWKKAEKSFTLDTETEIAIIIMNSKYGEGAAILVDDVTLTTTDGGLADGTEGGGTEGGENEGAYINETFATSLGAFTTQQTVDDYAWFYEEYNGKGYAKASGYANNASQEAESWLISPAIDFTEETAANISFDYVINKGDASAAAANHKLMITSNYTGDFATTEWTEVNFGAVNNNNWTFHNTDKIALPETMMGKAAVVIAFKYTSTTANSSTWEVMNVVVSSGTGKTPDQPENPDTPDNPGTPEEPIGDNLLVNGDFEEWNGSNPTAWGSGNIGHNATIAQSTEAYSGSYAVIVSGSTSANKRLGSKSYKLSAGTYTISAYIKQSGSAAGAFKLGYGAIKNGAIANADYVYQKDAVTVTSEWKLYTHEFTLTQETEIAALVMNSKVGNGNPILVDNITLTTADGNVSGGDDNGGNEEGGNEQPDTPANASTFTAVTSITSGAQYIIAAGTNQAAALDASKNYGYLPVVTVSPSNGTINTTDENVFVIEAVDGGYSIKDAQGRYLYMTGTYNSVNLSTSFPSEGGVWTIEFNADGTAKITNTYNGKFMQFDSQYNSYGIYSDNRGEMPTLYKKN